MVSEYGDGYCRYYSSSEYSSTVISTQVVNFLYCASGQFKLYGMLTCVDCPVGHSCPIITNPPVVCYPGTYSNVTGLTSCKTCATGYYSVFGQSQCSICPAGYQCPDPTQVPQ